MSEQDRKHDVFISYSTKNSDVANKVCYVLEQNNLKCWIAPRNISSGRIYIDEIGDAIKSTKIVVLIYSVDSQESKYVNNEINMAFSNNKKIISFNIDNSMPKENMEYFLKITQWLSAYPDPEAEFETLVKDALELCNETSDVPILVDLTHFNDNDLSKHKKDYVSLILLFTPIYWASFIYMGMSSNKKLWTLMGLVYLIPTIMYLVIKFGIWGYLFVYYDMLALFGEIFIIFWILAIIHGFVIRNEYLTRKSVLRFTSADKDLFKYLYDEYLRL
ncbi:MAG: toll/interleukin-1 receptor domain-containing protein [Methanobrevibacter sp.]|nr:toll/interleukin-1 receptor domain-containing protein [Methanobrevibacter sp.]